MSYLYRWPSSLATARVMCAAAIMLALLGCEPPQTDDEGPSPGPTTDETTEDDGMMGDGMMGDGMMGDGMMGDGMMDDGPMDRRMMEDMRTIRTLLRNHDRIDRRVEDIPGGVKTETTSEDPEIADAIRLHVDQMETRLSEGRPIRRMDPLFRELFEHREAVNLDFEPIDDGLRVHHTSPDPEVTKLIRQHAYRAVDEFVEYGMQRAMQPTHLPEDYRSETEADSDGDQ